MKTPPATADAAMLRGEVRLPAPSRVPCISAIQRDALSVRDALETALELTARRALVTVRPSKLAA